MGYVGGDYEGGIGTKLMLCALWDKNGIGGAFRDNFTGLSSFGFCRNLSRTKTQQGTDEVSKHSRYTLF